MFIQTEATPNPNSLKFIPGCEVGGNKVRHYGAALETKDSPLAQELFKVEDVTAVFLGSDFITVSKKDNIEWELIKPEILTIIMEYFTVGKKVFIESSQNLQDNSSDDTQIVKEIKELIDGRIRPAVAQDGGDIIFHSFENGIVKLELHGACSGCPSSTITLKNGIENMLKYYIPEVIEVQAVSKEN